MKSHYLDGCVQISRSHPSRGAWIEIISIYTTPATPPRRTPHGVRGLKLLECQKHRGNHSRTPHGVRGLKSIKLRHAGLVDMVAPLTGCVD